MPFSFGRGAVYTSNKGSDSRTGNYAYVLAASGDYRLIVTLNGARYCLQHQPFKGSGWNVVSWAVSLSVLIGRFPSGLAFEGLSGLPENPLDVPRNRV